MRTTIYGDGITSRLVWRVSTFLFNAKGPPSISTYFPARSKDIILDCLYSL